jgi:hypothetical protein
VANGGGTVALNVEWRVQDGADAIAVIDPNGIVAEVAIPDEVLLKDFLAVASDLNRWRTWTVWHSVGADKRDPQAWGELVMGRSESGDVVSMNPELFWERVQRWFRSRGVDYNT